MIIMIDDDAVAVHCGRPIVGDRRRACGDVTEGMTPLTAAAQGDYYEIIQMLLKHGHVVSRPHIALCECEDCVRVEKTLEVCRLCLYHSL